MTLKALLFVKKEIKDNLKDFLKDFHFLKDNLQPWIMERYIPVTHPHHLISLNLTYFPTVPFHQEKLLEVLVKLKI